MSSAHFTGKSMRPKRLARDGPGSGLPLHVSTAMFAQAHEVLAFPGKQLMELRTTELDAWLSAQAWGPVNKNHATGGV